VQDVLKSILLELPSMRKSPNRPGLSQNESIDGYPVTVKS
jgi:hypothetical protein